MLLREPPEVSGYVYLAIDHAEKTDALARILEQYAYVKELAKDPRNIVVGLVRDKETADKQLTADGLAGKNATIMKSNMTDRPANEVRYKYILPL